MNPPQAISLDVALHQLFPAEEVSCRLMIDWPHDEGVRNELGTTIHHLLKDSPFDYVFVNTFDNLSRDEISHFFYAHDVIGDTVHKTAEAFPRAIRVCIGDALGLVCDREYHVGLVVNGRTVPFSRSLWSKVERLFQGVTARRKVQQNRSLIPDVASLILPVDQTGNSLLMVPLEIPPKDLVLKVIRRMADNFPELDRFIDKLGSGSPPKSFSILLTENHSEAGFITLQREIEMYASVIAKNIEKGGRILVKGHPNETYDRVKPLQEYFGDEYEVIGAPNSLKRIPIELWPSLLTDTRIICMSYPTLSLQYLYGKSVVNPVNDQFLETWFEPKLWSSYKNAHHLYEVPRKKLATWNGRGLLAKGPF